MFSSDDLAVSSSWYPDSVLWKYLSAAIRLDVQGQLRQVERYDHILINVRPSGYEFGELSINRQQSVLSRFFVDDHGTITQTPGIASVHAGV